MRNSSILACFLALSSISKKTTGFVNMMSTCHNAFDARLSAGRCGTSSLAMTSEQPSRPTTRGEAIAAAAAGLLSSLAGASMAGATAPEALASCPADSNCVSSTSFKLVMQGRYLAPWYYAEDSSDPKAAFAKLEDAVAEDPNLRTVEKDPDAFYISALARSAVPPDGFDKVEFLLKPADGLVTFRSSSLKNVYAGPVIVGDGGSNKNRLETLRRRLGWPERGIDGYMKDQGIDSGTSKSKGFLSELGWRQGESQSYGEDDEEY